MQYRRLGRTGLTVSSVSLGSWMTFSRLGEEGVRELVALALDQGVNLLDTADIYDYGQAEELLGRAIRGRKRESLVLATKTFWPMSDDPNDRGLGRKHLFESCHASLRRLGVDYLDLYQCHRFDPEVPLEETIAALGDLIRQGRILYWGTSCWSAEQLRRACTLCDRLGVPRPASEQPRYNLLHREIEEEVVPAARELGLGLLVWSPLAQGLLTGKYRRGQAPPPGSRAADPEGTGRFLVEEMAEPGVWERIEALEEVAQGAGLPLARLALAWCLRNPAVSSVLVGATRPEQLRENLAAAELEWTPDLEQAVEAALAQGA